MLRITRLLAFLVLGLSAVAPSVLSQVSNAGSENKSGHPEIVKEMRKMYQKDQGIRLRFIEEQKKGTPPEKLKGLMAEWRSIDHVDTEKMKQWVGQYGWLGANIVGKKGADMAWLFVQHADADPKFQRKCLDLMAPMVKTGEVSKQNFAYLTDRVLLAEGKKQLYGTQFTTAKDGEMVPQPIEDEKRLDARRKEMGLGSFAEYAGELRKMYGKPTKRKGG